MPSIKRQNTKSAPSSQENAPAVGNLLSRARDVKQIANQLLKVSLYGRGKTGKTRVVSTFPKPILILGAEDGTKSIEGIEGVKFLQIILEGGYAPQHDSWIYLPQLPDLLNELEQTRSFKTVCVDTASALNDLMLANILGYTHIPEQKTWGTANKDQYMQLSIQLKTTLKQIISLPINVVITAHEKNFSDPEEGGSQSELLFPSVGSYLGKSTAAWLNGAVDYICQTYIQQETRVETIKVGEEEQEIHVGIPGSYKFSLRIGPHPVYQTGFRVKPGIELPDNIINPSYDKIMAVINGKYDPTK